MAIKLLVLGFLRFPVAAGDCRARFLSKAVAAKILEITSAAVALT